MTFSFISHESLQKELQEEKGVMTMILQFSLASRRLLWNPIQKVDADVSCRFIEVPDEVIVTILKKMGDPKTLIRCSTVCKHLQCLVSKVDTVSIRFSYPGEAREGNKSWLKNPQNLVCWLKKENKHRLGEKLWSVHKWEGDRCNVNKSIIKERDVEELLRLLTRMTTMTRYDENAHFLTVVTWVQWNPTRLRSVYYTSRWRLHLFDSVFLNLRDAKTLIRCSSVCKHLQCLVPKVDTVSLRFSYPGEPGEYLPCWKSHYHIPQSEIPAIMKLFANLKFLEINLCLCRALLPCIYGEPCRHGFMLLLKSVNMNDKMHTHMCAAFQLGSLLSDDEGILSRDSDVMLIGQVKSSLMLSFFLVILCHQPKTLRSMVILSAGILGNGLEGKVECRPEGKVWCRSEGNLFMESQHLARFRALSSETRVNKSWLEDPENLVCWLKKHEENEHRLEEKLWLIRKWEGERCSMNKTIVKDSDVEELVRAFDGDDGEKQ
ncbi:unnamed protein product [Dovyalis caffra]|uniref:F-box domain-containing protein n=1 Tax=Dovyalis caffra TaxID=77055 RepID=A0AAV1RU55_9ROSI|nr:unnamed protein product [Dovyalis caffra]